MSEQPIKIGISHGDINGISYEILLKAFNDKRLLELFTPVIYGSSKSASYHRKVLDHAPVHFHIIQHVSNAEDGKINLLNCVQNEVRIVMGSATPEAGESAFIALERAVEDLNANRIDALVTLPISKVGIQSENFNFPGHTEFLENRCGEENSQALMIMASDVLKVALVTTHLPIAEVSANLSQELIVDKIKALNHSLKRDFKVEIPRIAVLGLNPHAGEDGLLGKEEQDIIAPAIKICQDEDIFCAGPYAADGFFGTGNYRRFDAVLAMYHDQGLIPFKTLAMDSGVNFTAGLPVVRTSPDHGTGYDIVGKGVASEESFRQAIYMAIDIFRNRRDYDEARSNPLPKLFFDRGKDEYLDLDKED